MALVEASVEGLIDSVTVGAGGTSVDVVAMGMRIHFTPGRMPAPNNETLGREKSIKTPTKTLSIAEFASTAPFPGRTQPGFVGATIIAEGVFDTTTQVMEANFITVEPGETVLLGALTQNQPGMPRQLRINSVPIAMLTDLRMSSNPDDPLQPIFKNQYGFSMDISSAQTVTGTPPELAPSSAEGYFANGAFHSFLFEYGGTGTLLKDPVATPQISFKKSEYRDEGTRIRIEATGFLTSAHAGNALQAVELSRLDFSVAQSKLVESVVDNARVDVDVVDTNVQRWRVSFRGNKPGGFRAGPPVKLIVRNRSVTITEVKEETEPDRIREA